MFTRATRALLTIAGVLCLTSGTAFPQWVQDPGARAPAHRRRHA